MNKSGFEDKSPRRNQDVDMIKSGENGEEGQEKRARAMATFISVGIS